MSTRCRPSSAGASCPACAGCACSGEAGAGTTPEPNAGTNVNARNPNVTVRCIQYKGGETGDQLDAAYYGYGLCEGEVIKVDTRSGEYISRAKG